MKLVGHTGVRQISTQFLADKLPYHLHGEFSRYCRSHKKRTIGPTRWNPNQTPYDIFNVVIKTKMPVFHGVFSIPKRHGIVLDFGGSQTLPFSKGSANTLVRGLIDGTVEVKNGLVRLTITPLKGQGHGIHWELIDQFTACDDDPDETAFWMAALV